ncbi:uncharacterized protein CEXT_626541 [Caerostris extrusa]|uniref:PKD domain-containing protein n=1 Tax=Caerostris extrusa TaxID=172846 RepID=A0AAV4QBY1_CAEEX|nr:uncharacterized protein CEXT_626541 [Caerostris extrusa]
MVLKMKKEAIVVVTTALSGLSLWSPQNCTKVGTSAMLEATLDNGMNVTFSWMTDEFGEKYYNFEEAPVFTVENYTCFKEGNFSVTLNVTDGLISEEAVANVCCVNLVSRNWILKTNSPRIAPPGEITISLYYTGNKTYFPQGSSVDIDFGDNDIKIDIPFEDESFNVTETHIYQQGGVYNVTAQVSNSFDTEFFGSEVLLLDKLSDLIVYAQYSEDEDGDIKDLHGPQKTDVPLNAFVNFTCNISGTVENYTMEIEEKVLNQDFPQNVFRYKFESSFELLEESNNVTLRIRVMSETTGLGLQASPSSIKPGEEVTFNIEFVSTDPFTCISFDADEGEMVIMFVSSIIYSYETASTFHPVAKAFNTIFEVNVTAEVVVAMPPSNIWIEKLNSTNIKRPMTMYFKEETFRLETTALVYDHPSRSYEMNWQIDKITPSNDVIETIDISGIRSSNCSALRIPSRF